MNPLQCPECGNTLEIASLVGCKCHSVIEQDDTSGTLRINRLTRSFLSETPHPGSKWWLQYTRDLGTTVFTNSANGYSAPMKPLTYSGYVSVERFQRYLKLLAFR